MQDIMTKEQAEQHFVRAYLVRQLKEMYVRKLPANKGFASKIVSNKKLYYVKFERSVKWLDQYTGRRQVYHTINKDLIQLPFDVLMVIDQKGRIWKINRETIQKAQDAGYLMTTSSQNESVVHIPQDWAECVYQPIGI